MALTAKAGTKTYPPTVLVQPIKTAEQQKYEKMWNIDDYRAVSPGETSAQTFLQQAKPLKDSTCIDFGCGTGRGGLMVALFGDMIVTLVDFAENALDEDVRAATITQPHRISWVQADLNKPLPVKTAGYGYCTDVMEHIPPEEVDTVLRNILQTAAHVFFQISTVDDIMGERIGEPLHLSIHPYEWWLKKLRDHDCVIHWSQDYDGKMCQMYVSSWCPKVEYEGSINTEEQEVLDNIRASSKIPHQLVHPHPLQEREVIMLCGGPSLNDYVDEIIKYRAQGMALVTTNGTYNWAVENGMQPSMQLILDAREFNTRFLRPLVDGCKYMLASQCHPALFEGIPEEQLYIWHATGSPEAADLLDELYEIWFPVPGGSTVTLRGLCLLRMLGFHKIHMYGFDSCRREDAHHAYAQPENDYKAKPIPVHVSGRVFYCDPWMYSQAQEWMQVIGKFGDEINLDVKGDGLIAHIIKTGAELSALDKESED